MNSEQQVKDLITTLKTQGVPLSHVAWQAACACVGWPYVYGATGEECRPAKRAQYGTKFYLQDHKTIVTKCKAISWDTGTQTAIITGSCSGCQWNLPVLMFDCRGFTRKILQMVYGWTLQGAGATSQWNTEENWKAKGTIDSIPKDTLVCLFVKSGKTMEHTGFGFNNETCECSNGVQHFTTRNKKWTNWAIPACEEGDAQPMPDPAPAPEPKPDQGTAVVVGGRLNMRQGPSKSCKVVTQIPNGKTVQLMDLPDGWTYVGYNNKQGFVMDDYIRKG